MESQIESKEEMRQRISKVSAVISGPKGNFTCSYVLRSEPLSTEEYMLNPHFIIHTIRIPVFRAWKIPQSRIFR